MTITPAVEILAGIVGIAIGLAGYIAGRCRSSRIMATKLADQTARATFFESEIDRLSLLVPFRKKGKFAKRESL